MERAGPTAVGAIRPADLVAIAEQPGPFATVWLGRAGVGAMERQGDRARSTEARSSLESQGAPEEVLDAIDRAIHALAPGAHGAVIVARGGDVLLAEELPEPPRVERAVWAPLPAWSPVLEHRQARIATIVVLADRTGADLIVHGDGADRTVEVEGDDYPFTKTSAGGWSQRRYQQRAEDSWERNADEVAHEIEELATSAHPELVVLGGDERAVGLIRDSLPERLQPITRTMNPGRATDGSDDQRERAIRRLIDTAVASETVDLLRQFAEEDARDQRAANGVDETLRALQQSQVDVLLVHDDPEDDRTAWFASQPGLVASDRAELEAITSEPLTSARLVDVAVHAALRTGAAIRIVPDAAALEQGLGALLRWTNEPAT